MKKDTSTKRAFVLAFLSVLSMIILLFAIVLTGCKAAAKETASNSGGQTEAGGNSSPVGPSIDTVKDKSYPISRELYIYADMNNYSKIAQAFIDFILSSEGQNIGTEAGFVPLK